MQTQYSYLYLSVFLLGLLVPAKSQYIPEEVRINQYIAKYHSGAEPRMSGLYFIKKKETSGNPVTPGCKVTVHYEGKLLNLQVIDSSYKRGKPATFRVGEGNLIAGWEEGISLMREGETAVLIIPSYLGYGDKKTGHIPANSPLVFTIELLKIER